MSRYDLANERRRTLRRPSEEPVALLALLVVRPAIEPSLYAMRLRQLISAAVDIAQSSNFESGAVSLQTLPKWFLDESGEGGDTDISATSRVARQQYVESRGADAWDPEDWIYCFDPDLRAWSWWDITIQPDGSLGVWVDTKGEAHIPCEELWWAVYLAGARDVAALTLEDAGVWAEQASEAVTTE